MGELFYIPMQAVQPSVPAGSTKNCPFGLRQQSSMLTALNSSSVGPQFLSVGLVPGVLKHLTSAPTVGNKCSHMVGNS